MWRTGLLSLALLPIITGFILGQTTPTPEPIGPPKDRQPTPELIAPPKDGPSTPSAAPESLVPATPGPANPPPAAPAHPGESIADKDCPAPCPPAPVPFSGDGTQGPGPEICCWFEAEYLLWQLKGSTVRQPLVVAGSAEDPVPGGVGLPTTQILFGAKDYNDDWQFNGGRVRAGVALVDGCLGAEFSGFYLEKQSATLDQIGNLPDQAIGRPFFDPGTDTYHVKLLSFTDAFSDGVHVGLSTQLWGAEGNFTFNIPYLGSVDSVFVGGRYMRLDEDLRVTDQVTTGTLGESFFNGQPQNVGDKVVTADRFQTTNQFYGGQVGFVRIDDYGPLLIRWRGSLAAGSTRETLTILGSSTYYNSVQNTVTTIPGGFLAQPTNIGTETRNHFAVLPEFGATVGWRLTDALILSLGYNFLYCSSVIRPGEQVNIRIDPRNIPISQTYNPMAGAPDPVRLFQRSDFWAQGLTLGFTWTF